MNKFIFLDIDGVLNDDETYEKAPYGGAGIDDHHLYQLKHLITTTDAKVILSSNWRYNSPEWRFDYPNWSTAEQDWTYMNKKFAKFDIKIEDITHDRCLLRGNEIRMFLWRQTPPYSFVILDDLPITEFAVDKLLNHLVHTNPAVGLTWDDIWAAQEKLKIVESVK